MQVRPGVANQRLQHKVFNHLVVLIGPGGGEQGHAELLATPTDTHGHTYLLATTQQTVSTCVNLRVCLSAANKLLVPRPLSQLSIHSAATVRPLQSSRAQKGSSGMHVATPLRDHSLHNSLLSVSLQVH